MRIKRDKRATCEMIKRDQSAWKAAIIWAAFCASEESPNLGDFDFIFGCLLLVYYIVCYAPRFALSH